jgi:hypothetical protein
MIDYVNQETFVSSLLLVSSFVVGPKDKILCRFVDNYLLETFSVICMSTISLLWGLYFQIVHRRLAARNILLPFILLPNIAGFGPTTKDETTQYFIFRSYYSF